MYLYYSCDHIVKRQCTYTNPCIFVDTTMCFREVDAEWNITWPLTASGMTAQQKCPGGAESAGRYCKLLFHVFGSLPL